MGARTSAGKALGFMFIPLFNLYWAFEVYWGWTKDYNRIAEPDDVELRRMPERIGLAVCVLPLLSICLLIAGVIAGGWQSMQAQGADNVGLQTSMLVGLINTILMAVLYAKICDGVNALADAGLEPEKPQYTVPREDAKMSGLAIASLVLGICGFCTAGLTAIVGLILGIIGLKAIGRSAGQLKGHGFAVAGVAVSAVSVTLIVLLLLSIVALSWARDRARTMTAIAHANQLCLAFAMYCDENDGRFPPGDEWPDALDRYFPRNATILTSPFDSDAGRAWAMNARLSNRRIRDIHAGHRTVLIFEARFGSPPAGGPELLPDKPRGRKGHVILFADYHAECVPPERIDDLIWSP
jgi:hypothetical protein